MTTSITMPTERQLCHFIRDVNNGKFGQQQELYLEIVREDGIHYYYEGPIPWIFRGRTFSQGIYFQAKFASVSNATDGVISFISTSRTQQVTDYLDGNLHEYLIKSLRNIVIGYLDSDEKINICTSEIFGCHYEQKPIVIAKFDKAGFFNTLSPIKKSSITNRINDLSHVLPDCADMLIEKMTGGFVNFNRGNPYFMPPIRAVPCCSESLITVVASVCIASLGVVFMFLR